MSRSTPGGRASACAATVLALVCAAAPAEAQSAGAWPGRFEVAGGGSWAGGYPLGSQVATLTPNQTPAGDRFTLFATDSELQRSGVVDARLGLRLSPTFSVEGGFGYARPRVLTTIDRDAESAPRTSADERLAQYVVDASLVVHLRRFAMAGGRALPFVSGGAGYLRQLHAGNTLVETGRVYHLGGGLKYLVASRPDGFFNGFGLRADVRATVRDEGFELEGKQRTFGSAGVGVLVLF